MSTSSHEGGGTSEQEIEQELQAMKELAERGQLQLPGSKLGQRKMAQRRIADRRSAA